MWGKVVNIADSSENSHPSGIFYYQWMMFFTSRVTSINDFSRSMELSHIVHRIWQILLLCSSKMDKVSYGHSSGIFPDSFWRHKGCSLLLYLKNLFLGFASHRSKASVIYIICLYVLPSVRDAFQTSGQDIA